MAISLVNSTTAAVSAATQTISFTTSGGNYLIVAIGIKESGGAVGTISSVTYNGVAMTELVTIKKADNIVRGSIWGLVNPSSGGNYNIVITADAGTDEIHTAVYSWSGVNTVSSPRATNSASGTSSGPTVDVSSASGDAVVDIMAQTAQLISSAGANQADIMSSNTIGSSYETASGATTTMSWTLAGSTGWVIAAASLIARVDTAVVPSTKALTTTTFAPTVTAPALVQPGVANLATTKYAPDILAGIRATPNKAELVTTTYAPTVAVSNNILVNPTTLALLLTLFAPTVSRTVDPPLILANAVVPYPDYNKTLPYPEYSKTVRLT